MTANDRKTFTAILLLNEIINNGRTFPAVLQGDDKLLEPMLVELLAKDLLVADADGYRATEKGRTALATFMKRFSEFLKVYDIYSFVDPEQGEFAFARYFDFRTDAEWDNYKTDPRWYDLRIAVAQFKKLNPHEIVFMGFLNEGRFDLERTGWQMDLLSDALWDEIDQVVETAVKPEEAGEDFMLDMISQGATLMVELLKKEQETNPPANNASGSTAEEEVVEETVVEDHPYGYYTPYYDPFYVSPFWLTAMILW